MISLFIIVILMVIWFIGKAITGKPKSEWTPWEHHRDTTPLVTYLSNGDKLYQNQSHWVRFNNIKQKWDSKLIVDPVKRPFNKAISLSDAYNLRLL